MRCFKIKVSYFTPAVSNDLLTNKSTGLCFYVLISNSENLNRPKSMQIKYFPLSIKTKVYFSFVYCRICQIYCFANHLSFMKAYVLWNHLHDTCLALCLSMAATRSLSQSAPLYADRLIAPLSSLRRCTILWALINPMLPCSQACTHPLTPTANQLSLCITAAPHPPSPHASPCTPAARPKQSPTCRHDLQPRRGRAGRWPGTCRHARAFSGCEYPHWWLYGLLLFLESCEPHAFLMVQSSEHSKKFWFIFWIRYKLSSIIWHI